MSKKVLIIEDNQDIANLVAMHLQDAGYNTSLMTNGASGLKLANSEKFDLIILDLMLPDLDGLQICRELRTKKIYIPILMLTAKNTELDRVLGLEVGADDYLTKPFSIQELLARVKAIFRRIDSYHSENQGEAGSVIRISDLQLDADKRSVLQAERMLDLTAKEFDLLWYFASHPGRVYTRGQLLDQVWGVGHDGYEHTVNSHINRLRAKIENDPANPKYILTVWGVGYKFAAENQDQEQVATDNVSFSIQ